MRERERGFRITHFIKLGVTPIQKWLRNEKNEKWNEVELVKRSQYSLLVSLVIDEEGA